MTFSPPKINPPSPKKTTRRSAEVATLTIYWSSHFQLHKHALLHGAVQGAPPRRRQLDFTLPSAPDPLFKASKGTLSDLKSCNPVGGTPSSTAWLLELLELISRKLHITRIAQYETLRAQRLKNSISLEIFNLAWKLQSRLNFFNLWALRESIAAGPLR